MGTKKTGENLIKETATQLTYILSWKNIPLLERNQKICFKKLRQKKRPRMLLWDGFLYTTTNIPCLGNRRVVNKDCRWKSEVNCIRSNEKKIVLFLSRDYLESNNYFLTLHLQFIPDFSLISCVYNTAISQTWRACGPKIPPLGYLNDKIFVFLTKRWNCYIRY
jgi:hypothetical protein